MESPASQATPPKPSLLRTLLVLGRVSNLPTVWSNCLAGWLIAGGSDWIGFSQLCAGTSLLYIGGMFLNDACDVWFDRQFRPDRPIPAGAISRRAVWLMSGLWLGLGAGALLLMDSSLLPVTAALVACIVGYDLLHKHTALAPVVMGGCRFLLYLVAGAAAADTLPKPLISSALAMALYVVGLSYVARTESKSEPVNGYAVPLLLAPIAASALVRGVDIQLAILWVCFLGWVWFALHPLKGSRNDGQMNTVVPLAMNPKLVERTPHPDPPHEPEDGGTNTSPRPSPHLAPPPLPNAEREKRSPWAAENRVRVAAGLTVSRLLAGIALADMLAAPGGPDAHTVVFVLLFGSALILQRTVPAT